jgi:hypothetical protein
MKTIILGNGIIALTIAYRLAKESGGDDQVIVIGKSSRIGSATFAAPAMLNSFAELEGDSLSTDIDLFRFNLSIQATKIWKSFESEIYAFADEPSNFAINNEDSKGTYVINNAASDYLDDENFNAIINGLEKYNEPYTFVNPEDIPNYHPEQKYRALKALYINNESWINPKRFLSKLILALKKFPQISFLEKNVEKLVNENNKLSKVVLEDKEEIYGDNFIIALGASTTNIIDKSNLKLNIPKIFYGVGVSIELKNKEFTHTNCIRTPNRGLACGLYTAPYIASDDYPLGHTIVGASNFISPIPLFHARAGSVEHLIRGAIQQINHNFFKSEFISTNIGWRPTSQDLYPILGRTSIGNLILATGTKREGFHLSPIISEYIVDVLFNRKCDDKFEYFKPERQLIKTITREQAINKFIKHQLSAAYQHDFNPPTNKMIDNLISFYKQDLEKLHDSIGAFDWGIPTEMIDMYRYGHAKVNND